LDDVVVDDDDDDDDNEFDRCVKNFVTLSDSSVGKLNPGLVEDHNIFFFWTSFSREFCNEKSVSTVGESSIVSGSFKMPVTFRLERIIAENNCFLIT
jgi:hypothetical protein